MPDIEELPEEIETVKTNTLLAYANRIAMGEAGDDYVYCMQEDKFYIYEAGVWRGIFDIEFLANISHAMPSINRFSIAIRKQILDNYKVIRYKSLNEFNTLLLLNFKNYMVDVKGNNVLSHEKNYYSTIQLPYEYRPQATCELWLKTLQEIFEGDSLKIDILQEFFGYCLVPDMEQKKALLLLGESDTGKSTILFTLRDLIGQVNCSSVPLKYLSNAQYTPMMVNKLVNIDADVDKNASNYEAEFKMITSGEPINCNQKFIETFEFIPVCKIVLAANVFPKITDHSSAFYKRLILIPCDRIFDESEKNRALNKLLKEELPGILNWAITGLHRLKKRGRFEQHEFMKTAVQELENENNPSNLFFDECIEIHIDTNTYIEKGDLYVKYSNWCAQTKNYVLSQSRFSTAVLKRFSKISGKNCQENSTGKRIWRNLRYKGIIYQQRQDITWQ